MAFIREQDLEKMVDQLNSALRAFQTIVETKDLATAQAEAREQIKALRNWRSSNPNSAQSSD